MKLVSRAPSQGGDSVRDISPASASTTVAGGSDQAIDTAVTEMDRNTLEILESQASTVGLGAVSLVSSIKDAALVHMPGMMHRSSSSQPQMMSPHKLGRTLHIYSVDDEATVEALGKQVSSEQMQGRVKSL